MRIENINYIIIYSLITIILIGVIILFVKIQKNNTSKYSFDDDITLENLKVKNLQTNNISSIKVNDKVNNSININDSIQLTNIKSSINTQQLNTAFINATTAAYIQNLKTDNCRINKLSNDNTITEEEFYTTANKDKENYNKRFNL